MTKPRCKKTATALSPERADPQWQMIDEKIGGRTGLLEAALVSADPKAATLADLLADPAFKTSGTKALARKAGLTAPEVVDLYRNKKWLETTLILHDKLPDIVDGAADDAKPKMVPCSECKASGKNEHGDNCWVCGGWGEIRKAGDKDKLSFIGEASGLIKRGGPAVQINQQTNINTGNAGNNSFEELMRRAQVTTTNKKQIEAPEAELVGE